MGAETRPGKARRKGLLVGGGVVALALAGGGAWAAMSFLSTGAQPAEALPADALGYASIDLDPSGGQKIEALSTLNKFPAFEDSVGLDPEDDLRATLFELLQEDGTCADLDFADDIDPWLGDRAAVAAVSDAEGAVQPVVVVQVDDAGAAETGLDALAECGGGEGASDDTTEWVIEGDWAVVAPVAGLAQSVVDAAAESSLADDESFQRWTGETGEAGIVTMYAAPAAAQAVLGELGDDPSVPEELRAQIGDFEGAAATIRFADGALELEAVGEFPQGAGLGGVDPISDAVAGLPDDTAAALGIGFADGWAQTLLDQVGPALGGAVTAEDLETLTAGGLVLSVGPGLDAEQVVNSLDPTQVPVAITLRGDAAAIEQTLESLRTQLGPAASILTSTTEGDTVVVGPDEDYRAAVAAGGDLGGSEAYRAAVALDDSSSVLFLDVDAFEATLDTLLSGDESILGNITPLSGIGVSSTTDGDTTRFVLRVGTDD